MYFPTLGRNPLLPLVGLLLQVGVSSPFFAGAPFPTSPVTPCSARSVLKKVCGGIGSSPTSRRRRLEALAAEEVIRPPGGAADARSAFALERTTPLLPQVARASPRVAPGLAAAAGGGAAPKTAGGKAQQRGTRLNAGAKKTKAAAGVAAAAKPFYDPDFPATGGSAHRIEGR